MCVCAFVRSFTCTDIPRHTYRHVLGLPPRGYFYINIRCVCACIRSCTHSLCVAAARYTRHICTSFIRVRLYFADARAYKQQHNTRTYTVYNVPSSGGRRRRRERQTNAAARAFRKCHRRVVRINYICIKRRRHETISCFFSPARARGRQYVLLIENSGETNVSCHTYWCTRYRVAFGWRRLARAYGYA